MPATTHDGPATGRPPEADADRAAPRRPLRLGTAGDDPRPARPGDSPSLRAISSRLAGASRRLGEAAAPASAAPEAAAAEAGGAPALPSVMVVDDEAGTRSVLSRYLRSAGYRVHAAADGAEALACDAAHAPGVVVLDWMMPGLSGPDLCRALRRQRAERGGFAYLIMLTAVTEKARLVEALDAGADDFLTKPFDPDELLARLRAGARVVRLESELAAKVELGRELNARLLEANGRLGAANEELARMADTDALTGLKNRRRVTADLASCVASAASRGGPLAVAMCDLDHFKSVNDRLGHGVGDRLLVEVAAALSAAADAGDVVGRLGGDEFVVVMPGATAGEGLARIERCRSAVAAVGAEVARRCPRGEVPPVTLSAGVAEWSAGMAGPDDLLTVADDALYAAKRAGRNGASVRLAS